MLGQGMDGGQLPWGPMEERRQKDCGQKQGTEIPGSTNCTGDWPSTGHEDHSCRKGY